MSFDPIEIFDMTSPAAKQASYALLKEQAKSILEGERDWLANLAQWPTRSDCCQSPGAPMQGASCI